jgi:pimeloyl-ACP methyl ester carboxylesterase
VLSFAFVALTACSGTKETGQIATTGASSSVPYGHNDAVGKTFTHDGVTLYYEVYGTGQPLLLIHGNGGSIATLSRQIAEFSTRYQVITMDSRDQGKSGDSKDPLTYERMTDDLAALLDHLKVGKAHVFGWSDGGIEALLLGLRHPDKVEKLVAMAANLNPGTSAVYDETWQLFNDLTAAMPDSVKQSPEGQRSLKAINMMYKEPNITPMMLAKVTAPTLVMAGDHDLIRLSHTLQIFEALPNAQLAILPGATHAVPFDDPTTFNAIVERFLTTPFKKTDRIADFMTSYEKLLGELAH